MQLPINSINKAYAPYSAICKRWGNICPPSIIYRNVLPHGISIGNVNQRQNDMSKIAEMTAWTVNDWSGGPLRYFDEWIESLPKSDEFGESSHGVCI